MLEKLGLPAKPAMRGGEWVLDATHCQGCSTAFSLFNRKHHCQRCGGLFCGNCTQQRMILRGQGDAPVRICDPCKKIEDAARMELKTRYKNNSRATQMAITDQENEVLLQVLGTSRNKPIARRLIGYDNDRQDKPASSSSAAATSDVLASIVSEAQADALNDSGAIFTPDELRQQAIDEKQRYKDLKAEGKTNEAMLAFKHSKELERRAAALEIELRKSRRNAAKPSRIGIAVVAGKGVDFHQDSATSTKASANKKVKKDANDLTSELKELGWSDADLHGVDIKQKNLSVEGELWQLLEEVAPRSSEMKRATGIDRSQVNSHKKLAIQLKKEGKLAEAKEELKKAKILEKQLEEQEILGESEESDDELAGLMRSMKNEGNEKYDIMQMANPGAIDISLEQILSAAAADDFTSDGHFDVSHSELNDPEMVSMLESIGWNDEDGVADEESSLGSDRQRLHDQVQNLKKEAVMQKREGNIAAATELLRKAKLLEKDLEAVQPDVNSFQVPAVQGIPRDANLRPGVPSRSKLAIQKELLALKKRALALSREGKMDEAEAELNKGKILEKELEELENRVTRRPSESVKTVRSADLVIGDSADLALEDSAVDAEVTEQDMKDPTLLSDLSDLGWNDDDSNTFGGKTSSSQSMVPSQPQKSRGQIQKELLAIRRKARALRLEGRHAEAEKEAENAKALEDQLVELDASSNDKADGVGGAARRQKKPNDQQTAGGPIDIGIPVPPLVSTALTAERIATDTNASDGGAYEGSFGEVHSALPQHSSNFIDLFGAASQVASQSAEVLTSDGVGGKRSNFVSFGGKESSFDGFVGKESSIPQHTPDLIDLFTTGSQGKDQSGDAMRGEETVLTPPMNVVPPIGVNSSSEDALREEILLHKRKALALKQGGKLAEAREELRLAKILEKTLQGGQYVAVDSEDASAASMPAINDSIPTQLFSGEGDPTVAVAAQEVVKPKEPTKAAGFSSRDRSKITREALNHKRSAMKLRREGKTAEADAELELAKELESQLEEIDSSKASAKADQADDANIESFLDPKLMAALKSIGVEGLDFAVQPAKEPSPKPGIIDERRSRLAANAAPASPKPVVAAGASSSTAGKLPGASNLRPGTKQAEEPSPRVPKAGDSATERTRLEEQIKAEKLRALNLKHEGKQAEALEALRSAKRLEKTLQSLN